MPTEQMVMEWAIDDTPKPTRKIYAKDDMEFWQPTPKGYKYSIRVTPISAEGKENWGQDHKYSVSMQKEFGSFSGYGSCMKSKEEVIKAWRQMGFARAHYDGILGHTADPATLSNTYLHDFTGDFSLGEFLGIRNMFDE